MTNPPPGENRDSIRLRLLKVLRLAQQGVGGERENAEVLLEKLLRKHGMTVADLEGAAGQAAALVWLPASSEDERTIVAQLVVKMFGTARKVWQQPTSFNMGVEVTHAEHSALVIAWEVYRAAFAEARQALVLGFCFKHGLFAAEDGQQLPTSPEAQARAARAIAMAETLPTVASPAPRIGQRDDDTAGPR